ncbi:LptF/LptG family permease [Candidatus Pelagibacter sp.]|nr:LptF/LptG family permease [Candidatus Pelagibacter sp.]MDC1050131.1 LptF/LptG family permease [Candidatus Pelagibacter sp.]
MKKIIYRNIAQECTKFFLLILFTISIIIWVLQAVNYLDFVTEDGHGFLVYFNYTLLSFPRIFSKIFPFAVFLAFAYIILKYENRNELVIFWNFGIKKIQFINFFIKFSFWFVFVSILLNALIAPYTQDKARSFIRSSDLDFFESILKPKKFIDIVENLTIYFDERNENGELINIFLNDKSGQSSQITFAKNGKIENRGNGKILVLQEGITINEINGKISQFKFSKTDFNISTFSTRSTITKKTQETSTKHLIKCVIIFHKPNDEIDFSKITLDRNCDEDNLENIHQELYSRLIKPLYITFLITVSLLLILKSKNDRTFNINKIKIYSLGFISIIFFELSSKFVNTELIQNLIMIMMPIFFLIIIYLFILKILRTN